MASLWSLGGLSWRGLGKRVLRESLDDDILGRSAELAFYFLLSVFPLLLFLTSLLGYVVGGSTELRIELFAYLRRVIPSSDALALVQGTLQEIIDARGLGFSLGVILSLWTASQGMAAVIRVLNTAYEVERRYDFLKGQAVAVVLTVGFSGLVVLAMVLLFAGEHIAVLLADRFAFGDAFISLWAMGQWPLILLFLMSAFELIYNFAPGAVTSRQLHWTSPGAAVGMVVWLAASFGFRAYVTRFSLYTWAYGSLGTPIVLMLWFYLTGLSILVGGEVNSEIHKAMQGERLGSLDASEPVALAAEGEATGGDDPSRKEPAEKLEPWTEVP